MSCNIIPASYATINGSNSVYGGSIVSVDYAPSTINGYNKATVKIVNATTSPGANNSAKVNVAGLDLNMRVGGFTETVGVGSISSTTINYYDNSQALDNTHVLLKDEVPPGLGSIGEKYGPSPDLAVLRELGLIVPASDTVFVPLRGFYQGQGVGAAIDNLVFGAPGKTVYTIGEFMAAFGGILGSSFDLNVDDGVKVDFQGTLREVLVQMCNAFGATAYWDPESDTVVSMPISAPPPPPAAQSSSGGCTIVSSSTSVDYTSTRAQGACGIFQSHNPGDSQTFNGGVMSRYMQAVLLKPTLSIKVDGCGGGPAEFAIFDQDGNIDRDIAKAMAVAGNPTVYSMYVLESALNFNQAPPPADRTVTLDHGEDSNPQQEQVLIKMNPAFPGGIPRAGNDFLGKYYECLLEDVYLCDLAEKVQENWNEEPTQSPKVIAGDFANGTFERGSFLMAKKGIDNPIINDELELAGQGDILRRYLEIIPQFINSLYVVKASSVARGAVSGVTNYGYYITSSSAAVGQNFKFDDGFKTISTINPWASVADCGEKFFIELAEIFFSMHAGRARCFNNRGPAASIRFIDFIYALEKDNIAGLMGGVGNAPVPAVSADQQSHVMILGLREDSAVNPNDLTPLVRKCFRQNRTTEVQVPATAVRASQLIGRVSFKGGPLALFSKKYSIGVLNTNLNVDPNIDPISLNNDAEKIIRSWYNVEGAPYSLEAGTGHIMLGGGLLPPDGAWKSKMNTSVSVNAADIAYNNGMNQSYLASSYDEGFRYSKQNAGLMGTILANKVVASTWIDDTIGTSTTTTYLLENGNLPKIPSFGQGLDSLSISNQGGQTRLTISYGNASASRAKATLRDMHAVNSHLQHSQSFVIPNALNLAPNTALENIANGQK